MMESNKDQDEQLEAQEPNQEEHTEPTDDPKDHTIAEDESSHDSGVSATIGGKKVHLNEKQLPMVGVFIAALILLVALLVREKRLTDNYTYGIIAAAVAMFLGLVGAVYHHSQWNAKHQVFQDALAYFLFCWCFVAACVMTFSGPFELTGNGYFASWGMAIASSMTVGVSRMNVKENLSGFTGSIIGLLACAIVVICDLADEFGARHDGESIYAMIVSCLTVVVVAYYFYTQYTTQETGGQLAFIVLTAFAVLWVVLASLVTFRGPFFITGNGYFGAWAGVIASFYAAKSAHHHD